jgi:chromosome segregation ATPase
MKFLAWFNLAGVILLATLCIVQWSVNSRLNLRIIAMEKTADDQTQTIARQQEKIAGCETDLNDFRIRVEQAEKTVRLDETQIKQLEHSRDRLTSEKASLTAHLEQANDAIEEWMDAVDDRDAALKKTGGELKKATDERNAAVMKFNDLAGKYNDIVKDLNDARARLAKSK